MPLEQFCPKLSEAKSFLPLLRAQLLAAAAHYTVPASLSIDLIPIFEHSFFGYELEPNRRTHTCLAVGRAEAGSAVARRTLYPEDAPSALRLMALDGNSVVRQRVRPRGRVQQRDVRFGEIPDAVESALAKLAMLFPEEP